MKHGSLFSGIGGFDLAAEWMGWENVFHCEWNEFGQKVLSHYWPNAISYNDITKTDFTIHRGKIDILTGGFPCQPYSAAGKRLGKEDDRHLWPEMLRAIREIQPRWVVGENVLGLTNWNGGLVFEEVQVDLEAEGYEVQPFVLPAAAVNAPHRRDRVWFVAYRNSSGLQKARAKQQTTGPEQHGELGGFVAYAKNIQRNAKRQDGEQCGTGRKSRGRTERTGAQRPTPDTDNARLEGGEEQRGLGGSRTEREKQSPRFVCPNWEEFPTKPPVCGGNDGLPGRLDGITFPKWRNESIKAYGNAIVPQVAHQIFMAIEAYESLEIVQKKTARLLSRR